MENYSYNNNENSGNFQMIKYSISGAQNIYINNNTFSGNQLYNIEKPYSEYIHQTELYTNNLNIYKEKKEDFTDTYSKGIINNIPRIPEDSIKIPKDKIQNNKNYSNIKPEDKPSYINKNNINRINNNKINTINKIFVKNNQNYILYKDYNDIENNNKIERINNIEKKPTDNYKNCNLMNLNKIKEKEEASKESNLITFNKTEIQKNFQKNKITNSKINNSKVTKNCNISIKNENNDKNIKIININLNSENPKKDVSINNIENSNLNSLNNLRNKENNTKKINNKIISKNVTNPNSYQNNNKIFICQKSNNNDKINLKHNLYYNNKKKYLKKNKNNEKNELKKNFSTKNILNNKKIKEKEKSNFAFLINEKKKKLFLNRLSRNIEDNISNFENDSNINLSHLNYMIKEKKVKLMDVKEYKYNTNFLEDEDKKTHRNLTINNKDINKIKNNKNIKMKINCISRSSKISSNVSFNKMEKYQQTKEDRKISKYVTVRTSKTKLRNKFLIFKHLEDSIGKSRNKEKEYETIILNTENKEIIKKTTKKKLFNKNKSVLNLSNKNIKKEKIQNTSKNKVINISIKNSSNKETINKNKTRNNSILKNLSDKKMKIYNTCIYNNHKDNNIIKLYNKNSDYSYNIHIKKSRNLSQIKNYFSLDKINKRKQMIRNNTALKDKNEYHSTKVLFTNTKFEKNRKYKFMPLTIEKKNNLKKRRTTFAKESKKFAKLINSTTHLSEDENNLEERNEIKYTDRNRLNDIIDNDTENDIINNKSFILDLNNVIPIKDNKLIESVSKQTIFHINNEDN